MNNHINIRPRLEITPEKKLVGKSLLMSLANNKTQELWKSFMPFQSGIKNKTGNDFFSVNVYGNNYFRAFNPANEFTRWATVEVKNYNEIPPGMEQLILPGGLYAVFHYKGLSSDKRIFQYIYSEWLPNSGYNLDDRPHFEILGENYKNNDPESEEEIWIPVKKK